MEYREYEGSPVIEALSSWVQAWCAAEDKRRRDNYFRNVLIAGIGWRQEQIRKHMHNPRKQKLIRELRHQILHSEITLAFLDADLG